MRVSPHGRQVRNVQILSETHSFIRFDSLSLNVCGKVLSFVDVHPFIPVVSLVLPGHAFITKKSPIFGEAVLFFRVV